MYLHVLPTNTAAVSFYEQRNFRFHSALWNYYNIDNVKMDGYCYVMYINGGEPPWNTLYLLILSLHEFIQYIDNSFGLHLYFKYIRNKYYCFLNWYITLIIPIIFQLERLPYVSYCFWIVAMYQLICWFKWAMLCFSTSLN